MMDLESLQKKIGIQFSDLSLLQRALTHSSYLHEHEDEVLEDNERLEFLGDAVLDFMVAAMLYHRFPEMREGEMTRLRARLVRMETLAKIARKMGLNQALYLGHGEEESGGRERPGNLCAVFEAFVGALYLDQGLDAVREVIEPELLAVLEDSFEGEVDKDPKSKLQEWSQGTLGLTPVYNTVKTSGPDHAKTFTVEVLINGRRFGIGTGRSKQAASQEAARAALAAIEAGELP